MGTSFKDFVGSGSVGIIGIINTIIVPLIFALAFLVFAWGIVNYFFMNGGDEAKRSEGRQFAFWGILGIATLLAVWGFVNILLSTLNIMPSA